jgi:hypothetical protein
MPSTDRKLELTAKASMAQPVSQPAVCSSGLTLLQLYPCEWLRVRIPVVYFGKYTGLSVKGKGKVTPKQAYVALRVQ